MLLECIDELNESDLLSEDLMIELFSIEDPFIHEKKRQVLEDRAIQLKLKTRFNKCYLTYKKSIKKELTVEQPTYFTQFDDEPPLRSGVWRADMNGIWTLAEGGKVYACSHPIYPSAILQNIETKTCKVRLRFRVRNKWEEILIDRKIIASRNSIINLANNGVRVTSENAGALVRYLSDVESLNEFDIPEKRSTSRLGWVNGTFMPYEEDVIFDNENNVMTLFASIKSVGSRSKWYECVLEQRKAKRIELLTYLAASFASVLVEPLGILPFIVDLWGGTGKGKTVALMIATSIWADPNEGEYITDAKSTQTAMETRLDVLNSLPMMIDDMAQIKNKVDDFAELIYMLCSGIGKGRATKEMGLRNTNSWRNCILTNAEHSLISETMQGGAVNRVIDIECGNTDIFTDAHQVSDIIRKNFGFAGQEFVMAIKDISIEDIQAIQKGYFDQLVDESKAAGTEKEQKQLIPMSVILTADELSERILFHDGIRLEIKTCLGLLKNKNDVSEGIRAYNYLIETVGSNSFRFVEQDDEDYPNRYERWGKYIGDDKVAIISRFFDKIITEAGSQPRSFLSWADSKGLVEKDNKGCFKKPISYEGDKIRSVVIKRDWGMDDDFDEVLSDELPFE